MAYYASRKSNSIRKPGDEGSQEGKRKVEFVLFLDSSVSWLPHAFALL
jgi:hypothetical protein